MRKIKLYDKEIELREGLFILTFQYNFIPYKKDDVHLFFDHYDYNEQDKQSLLKDIDLLQNNLSTIDVYISKHLKGWTIDRLFNVDLAIIRVALFELFIKKDVYKEIVANEAVELAKTFGTKESPRLVNGIIGTIIRSEGIA